MRRLTLQTPLYEALGAKSPYLRRLEALGVKTVGDLLWHFPARYEDYSKVYRIDELEPGQSATIQAAVEDLKVRRTRRGMAIVEADLADEHGGVIRAVWFNQPFLAQTLRPGRVANFAGKISQSEEGELYLNHPTYEVLRASLRADGTPATRHTARLVPVYPETRGLTSRGIRFVMQNILRRAPLLKEWLPESTLASFGFPEINRALAAIHFPAAIEHATIARRRFDFENIFLLHLFNFEQKLKMAAEKASALAADIEKLKTVMAGLPFELTTSQKRALWEIIRDLEKPRPMNRLLQGDVGSGKTVVAALAALVAADNGRQTAFMAPTEILARQHFETMIRLLARPGSATPAIGLLTAGESRIHYEPGVEATVTKDAFRKKTAAGEITILFGTHALIEKSVSFRDLALVVIDEQHRFGVRQRQALLRSMAGTSGLTPHLLSMSATPIPRTLMLTVFGDLSLSLIGELPSGRQPIETRIVSPLERQSAYDLIRSEIASGRQAFVVCPRIEKENDESGTTTGTAPKNGAKKPAGAAKRPGGGSPKGTELKSVIEEYEKLSKTVFPDLRIAMLHGQMKPKEKEAVMARFKTGDINLLVSTSVIEVGVDIPNATIMMIESAERFGLAQLYQFRGRVGRGGNRSYCLLFTDATSESATARLRAIIEAHNGFELAEKDLELRGPGQFFGDIQTGFPDAAMAALQDTDLVRQSREAAAAVLAADPALASYRELKHRFETFKKSVHRE